MRVCMVAYSFYESDNRVMRYAETLAARGDAVEVISLRRSGQEKTGIIQGVRVCRVQERTRNEKGKLSYLLRILAFFLRAMLLLSWRQVRKPYQLIHVHSVPDFLVFTAWFPKLLGAKVVLDIHDILPEFYASKFGSDLNSSMFKALVAVEWLSTSFADHVIIANDLWHKRLLLRGVPANKCTAIVNTPDLSVFARQGKTRKDDKIVLIYPGTLNWHQGVDITIRAVASLRDKLPTLEFHVYGEGDARHALMELARELGVEDRILFHDACPIREVARKIEEADLGVVAKRADSFGDEAFSTKILEFMCMGVPAIIASTSIDRYYFNDSIAQFFPSGDVDELARCILRLSHDKAGSGAMAKRASEFTRNMTWDVHSKKYLRIVDDLVGVYPDLGETPSANDVRIKQPLHASQHQ